MNSFDETMLVSYDANKTWIENINNENIFCKKTSSEELENLKKIQKLINSNEIIIVDKKYKIKIPTIYCWDNINKVLHMQCCAGENLEILLRNKETHDRGVDFINAILDFLIANNIFWVDFAPRNILINEDVIYFVDFEKGIKQKNSSIYNYLRDHVYEEYALFLLTEERKINLKYVLKIREEEKKVIIPINKNKLPRIYTIAKKLGYDNELTIYQYIKILEMILKVEEPFLKKNQYYFPGVELDVIFRKNIFDIALDLYAIEIINRYSTLKSNNN